MTPYAYVGTKVDYDPGGEEPWLVDAGLAAACQKCIDEVHSRVALYEWQGFDVEMQIEQRVNPGAAFRDPREDCWGSADVILILRFNDEVMLVEIIDHKLGAGVWVELDSEQTLLYGVGGIHEHAGLTAEKWPRYGLRTSIIQPRHHLADPENLLRSRDWTLLEVQEFVAYIGMRATLTDAPDAPRVPGEKQCHFCAYKARCPEMQQFVLERAAGVFPDLTQPQTEPTALTPVDTEALLDPEPFVRRPEDLPPDKLAKIKEVTPLVRSWLNAVEEYARAQALKGERIPGWKIVAGRHTRKFNDEDAVAEVLGKANKTKKAGGGKVPRGDWSTTKILSPAQMEKQIKPVVSPKLWAKIDAQIVKFPGKPVLAPDSDPRESVKKDPVDVFGNVIEGEVVQPEADASEGGDNPLGLSIL